MIQSLTLEVVGVTLLTGQGADQLTIHVPAADAINKATEGKLKDVAQGTDIFGPNLHLELKITKGCGEQLAEELGLVVTNRIDI